MQDTDPEFDRHVQILSEAGRLDPKFASRIWEATNDKQIDALVAEGRRIIEDNSEL